MFIVYVFKQNTISNKLQNKNITLIAMIYVKSLFKTVLCFVV